MAIRVCDTIMGGGKTSAAINFINSDGERKIIFATPYLDQVDRILAACPSMNAPVADSNGVKMGDFFRLIREGKSVATTHALLSKLPQDILRSVREHGYILILDEVLSVLDTPNTKSSGIGKAVDNGWLTVDDETGEISVTDCFPDHPMLADMLHLVRDRKTFYAGGDVFFWSLDPAVFSTFEEIIILTYMFNCQMQKTFFDMHGIRFTYIGVEERDGGYFFTEKPKPNKIPGLKDRVHVVDGKINTVGDRKTALSAGWFDRNGGTDKSSGMSVLRKNLHNFFRNITDAKSADIMWSTFTSHRKNLAGKGYIGGFVPFNARATNDYRDRTALAYCVNIFMNPFVKRYFTSKGVEVDEDGLALSDMVQWIWRSAIRDGKEIQVYVPSSRMRNLLIAWLNEVS